MNRAAQQVFGYASSRIAPQIEQEKTMKKSTNLFLVFALAALLIFSPAIANAQAQVNSNTQTINLSYTVAESITVLGAPSTLTFGSALPRRPAQ